MNSPQSPTASNAVINVPNSLSAIRLIMAFAVGILIELGSYMAALAVFLIAASTDFVDGWWARKFNQVTKLGRILDPFVDKIIIAAAFIALVGAKGSGVYAWMVTLILGRELLVTSLRAMVEGSGGDFSARWLGKWKMVVQCAAVSASLLLLAGSSIPYLPLINQLLLWGAVLITVASGADYVIQALQLAKVPPSQS